MHTNHQWIVLLYGLVNDLPGLRLTPPGVVPQCDRQPRFVCDYTYLFINHDTGPITPIEVMQFGHALDMIIRNILLSDPKFGATYLHKINIADRLYQITLKIKYIPKLAVFVQPK